MIWRLLLRRPGTVLPGNVRFIAYSDTKVGDYRYACIEHYHHRY